MSKSHRAAWRLALAALGWITSAALAASNYQGLWWRSPAGAESGWGLAISHQGEALFATWFTYDFDGSQIWLVMPEGSRVGPDSYGGRIYQTTGPALDSAQWNPAQVDAIAVGDLLLTFTDASNGVMTYSVYGVGKSPNGDSLGGHGDTQTKAITREVFAAPVGECAASADAAGANYQDLWWGAPAGSESGWGVYLTQQGDTLFAAWFTYDRDRRGVWYVMPNGARTGPSTFSGNLYRTTGAPFNARPWNPSQLSVSAEETRPSRSRTLRTALSRGPCTALRARSRSRARSSEAPPRSAAELVNCSVQPATHRPEEGR
jgi:hypothetical protein